VQVRLLCNSANENDKHTKAVKVILQKMDGLKNSMDLKRMLNDWFDWMDYDKWKIKWQLDHTIDVNQRMKQRYEWVEQSMITYTPTFFINGRKLPGRYSIEDLEYLIPQLSEIIM
jgi:protein-disulfide isomerase